jgi:hypothetical protein
MLISSCFVYPLVKPTLDHVPCVVTIGTKITRARIFRFENFWMQHNSFMEIVKNAWKIPMEHINNAKRVIVNSRI